MNEDVKMKKLFALRDKLASEGTMDSITFDARFIGCAIYYMTEEQLEEAFRVVTKCASASKI